MKVTRCGTSRWDEKQHGLDLPHPIKTFDFRISGVGHDRIDPLFRTYCDRSRRCYEEGATMPEDLMASWLCKNASSFVFLTTPTPRCTVVSFLSEDDTDAFAKRFPDGRVRIAK